MWKELIREEVGRGRKERGRKEGGGVGQEDNELVMCGEEGRWGCPKEEKTE